MISLKKNFNGGMKIDLPNRRLIERIFFSFEIGHIYLGIDIFIEKIVLSICQFSYLQDKFHSLTIERLI